MIVFIKTDCKPYTGYRYILDSIKELPIGGDIKIINPVISTTLTAKFLFIIPLIATVIIPASLFLKIFFRSKPALMFVGSINNPVALFILAFNKVGFYMVDSLYDYYRKRLEGYSNFIRLPILFSAYLSEISAILLASNGIFLNSRVACRSFNLRYKFFLRIFKKKKCDFIPIGYTDKNLNLPSIEKKEGELVIGIYGNFSFFENTKSLDLILGTLCENQYVQQIRLAGPGFNEFDQSSILSSFPKVYIEGVVSSISEWKKNCDAIIIQAFSTNGVKVKLLECLSENIPFYTTKRVLRHLASPNKLNAPHLFVGRDFIDLERFVLFVLSKRSTVKLKKDLKNISWEDFKQLYNKILLI